MLHDFHNILSQLPYGWCGVPLAKLHHNQGRYMVTLGEINPDVVCFSSFVLFVRWVFLSQFCSVFPRVMLKVNCLTSKRMLPDQKMPPQSRRRVHSKSLRQATSKLQSTFQTQVSNPTQSTKSKISDLKTLPIQPKHPSNTPRKKTERRWNQNWSTRTSRLQLKQVR